MATQINIGDRIKFMGYTEDAYRNGSVPIFMENEGIVIDLDGKLYLKLDSEWILPLYYLDNVQILKKTEYSSIYAELTKEDELYFQLAGKAPVPLKKKVLFQPEEIFPQEKLIPSDKERQFNAIVDQYADTIDARKKPIRRT